MNWMFNFVNANLVSRYSRVGSVLLIGILLQVPNCVYGQNCPEVTKCPPGKKYPYRYCDINNTDPQNPDRIVTTCETIPPIGGFDQGGKSYQLIRDRGFMQYGATCLKMKDNTGLPTSVLIEDDPLKAAPSLVTIFSAGAFLDDIDAAVAEINCLCSSHTSNTNPDPSFAPDCCFLVVFSDDVAEFPNTGGDPDIAYSVGYLAKRDPNFPCEIAPCNFKGQFGRDILINNTASFISQDSRFNRTRSFFNGDNLPLNPDGSPAWNTRYYRVINMRELLVHELLHSLGIGHLADNMCANTSYDPNAVMTPTTGGNKSRNRLSNDDKCFIKGLYCMSNVTDVKAVESPIELEYARASKRYLLDDSKSEVSMYVPEGANEVLVTDFVGRTVLQESVSGGFYVLRASSLTPGGYVVVFQGKSGFVDSYTILVRH